MRRALWSWLLLLGFRTAPPQGTSDRREIAGGDGSRDLESDAAKRRTIWSGNDPRRGRVLDGVRIASTVLMLLGLAGSVRADAPPPRALGPTIRVTRVRGPRTLAAVHARVRHARVANCQHTLIGGDLLADVEIDAAGALTVRRTHAGEEIRSYGRCVERALGRLAFGPAAGVTRVRLIVSFPSIGFSSSLRQR